MSNDPRGTREFDEDGFHEIQLSGKQLVFLCMATTVVSIVIFLCGVLVGRGVRPVEPVAEAAAAQPAEAPAPIDAPAPTPEPAAPPANHAATPAPAAATPAPAASAPAAAANAKTSAGKPEAAAKPNAAQAQAQDEPAPPPDGPDELSYYDELARKNGKKGAKDAKAEKAAANSPTPAPAKTAAAESHAGGAIALQVSALKTRGDAESLARRLSSKGYAAYVVSPEAGGPAVFKVRVGNFSNADDANRVKRRLEQEEKLKPWIIR